MPGPLFTELFYRMSNDANILQRYVLGYEIGTAAPIYLIYNTAARNSSRRMIEDALERMDADYELVHEFSQKISRIERTLRRRRAILHNFLEPVAALPMEVLQRIFLHAIQPKEYVGGKHLPSPITLSQVCSTWRRAAQSYPQLWTVVRLELCNHYSYVPYARYSKGLPLELHEPRKHSRVSMMRGLGSDEVQGRITALSLPLDREDDWDAIIVDDSSDFWEERGVFNCESIERLALFAIRDEEDAHLYTEALAHLPSLRHLSLDNTFVLLSTTQLANLVTLTVSNAYIGSPELVKFINACQNIQELTLDRIHILWDKDEAITRQGSITFLHTLSVGYLNHSAARFLASYEMPQLHNFALSLTDNKENDYWDSIDVTSGDGHNLKPLRMVRDFIANTPTIKAVALKSGMKTVSYALKKLWPHPSHLGHDNLPSLTHLTISLLKRLGGPLEDIINVNVLIKAHLEGYQAVSRPLQRLTVPRCIFKADVNWVRSRVLELELTD
ncbi:uncharacterized protein EI90DRAFT_3015018 [Cantharellus anzutake]|uniref:uncharacterized protein n=1 Tax=Cantharellus anzutake TaxID=1750568 RepID=UPI001902D8AE|nr:uncharacterized protein EI90DRAFT_3015018 [Cantharellus anzutake]KAF8333927.1 hypothetical protein EI90DRAFT_3015018 [Cantharellus anzutake]